jgi:long-chain-fatty-acid--CoA ligase ACSBG
MDKLPSDVNDKRYILWSDFLALGKDLSNDIVAEKIRKQKPGKVSTLIYTSGTTGNPKACMISHDNLSWMAKSAQTRFRQASAEAWGPSERIVSYLPLSHIAGLLFDVISHSLGGGTVYFARPDAL